MILGIMVAILITITLWISPSKTSKENVSTDTPVKNSILPLIQPFKIKTLLFELPQ
jgi:hypothetical protein